MVAETSETTKKKNKETEAETREDTSYKEETAVSEEESSAEKDTVKESGEAIAREIADDDSIFEIDMDKYAEYSMAYRTSMRVDNQLQEVMGTYIGGIESGNPNGYGLLYYTKEVETNSGKATHYVTFFGEWENGNLKKGEIVKRRVVAYTIDRSKSTKLIVSGDWGDTDFAGNISGTYIVEELDNNTKEWKIFAQFEGTFDKDTNEPKDGKLYFSETGFIHEGEFKNWQLYNGTVHDSYGYVIKTIVNGEQQ